MAPFDQITALIPHRPPFLWVDRIVEVDGDTIVTEKTIPTDLEIFAGHYPGNPIMPGVLLCEAIFQSGALLMAKRAGNAPASPGGVPVLTRISNARFKRNVGPGDTVTIKVQLMESLTSASYFKGSMKVGGKTAVQVEFACALVAPPA